jgi:hypothetical protein
MLYVTEKNTQPCIMQDCNAISQYADHGHFWPIDPNPFNFNRHPPTILQFNQIQIFPPDKIMSISQLMVFKND